MGLKPLIMVITKKYTPSSGIFPYYRMDVTGSRNILVVVGLWYCCKLLSKGPSTKGPSF